MTEQIIFTSHSLDEMNNRGISHAAVLKVLRDPDQILDAYGGRTCIQSKVRISGKSYLIRVIVEGLDPITVITVYRTSKIDRYWSTK